jgi:hypothetical protein
MSKWEFTIKELKSLQQEHQDHQAIVELYVEQVLLKGYPEKRPNSVVYLQQGLENPCGKCIMVV